MQVLVRDNNVDQALKALKKKMQREGIFREMKLRRHFEKPSERRAREAAEARPPRPQARAQAAGARGVLKPLITPLQPKSCSSFITRLVSSRELCAYGALHHSFDRYARRHKPTHP